MFTTKAKKTLIVQNNNAELVKQSECLPDQIKNFNITDDGDSNDSDKYDKEQNENEKKMNNLSNKKIFNCYLNGEKPKKEKHGYLNNKHFDIHQMRSKKSYKFMNKMNKDLEYFD